MDDLEGEFLAEVEEKPPSANWNCGHCNGPIPDAERYYEYNTTAYGTHRIPLVWCQTCEAEEVKRRETLIERGHLYKFDPSEGCVLPTTIYMSQERQHAKHSPSSLLYKSKCPGFRSDEFGDKSAADAGTQGHLAFEKETLDVIPPEADERLRDAAQLCIDYKRQVISTYKTPYVIHEERIEVLPQVFGYIDCFVVEGDRGDLMDPKFAWNEYLADSPQFWCYAVGLFKKFPSVLTITTHILMPYRGEIDQHVYHRSDIPDLTTRIVAIIEAAKRADPSEFRTGEYCSFCGNKSTCPSLSAIATTIARNYNPDQLAIPAEYDPLTITDPQIMANALVLAPIMERWCEHAKRRGLQMRLEEGVEIPGFDLKERSSPFAIIDAQTAWEAIKDTITPEEYAGCAKVSIGALEAVWKEKAPKGSKANAARELRNKLIDADAARTEGTIHYLKRIKTAAKTHKSLTDED